MAMDARTRSSLYEALRPVIGDDNANALVTQFPTIEADELVTRQILRAEMAELRGELRTEMHDLASQLRTEMAELRGELRTEMHDMAGQLRTETHDMGRKIVMWNTGSILAGIGLTATIVTLLG